jgi:hypothetical protein
VYAVMFLTLGLMHCINPHSGSWCCH